MRRSEQERAANSKAGCGRAWHPVIKASIVAMSNPRPSWRTSAMRRGQTTMRSVVVRFMRTSDMRHHPGNPRAVNPHFTPRYSWPNPHSKKEKRSSRKTRRKKASTSRPAACIQSADGRHRPQPEGDRHGARSITAARCSTARSSTVPTSATSPSNSPLNQVIAVGPKACS